jgi:hypothetical protein
VRVALSCARPLLGKRLRDERSVKIQRAEVMILESIITCPHCSVAKSETMPTDACRLLYECHGCGARLRPKAADCCVFCSYGSVVCPPMQACRSGEIGGPLCCAG